MILTSTNTVPRRFATKQSWLLGADIDDRDAVAQLGLNVGQAIKQVTAIVSGVVHGQDIWSPRHFPASLIFDISSAVVHSAQVQVRSKQTGHSTSIGSEAVEEVVDDLEDRVSSTVAKLYALSDAGNDVELLRFVFGEVEGSFARSDLDYLNLLLNEVNPSRVKRIASIGLARAASRARMRLPAWNKFVVELWRDLSGKRLDAKNLMRGLVPANDSALFATIQTAT